MVSIWKRMNGKFIRLRGIFPDWNVTLRQSHRRHAKTQAGKRCDRPEITKINNLNHWPVRLPEEKILDRERTLSHGARKRPKSGRQPQSGKAKPATCSKQVSRTRNSETLTRPPSHRRRPEQQQLQAPSCFCQPHPPGIHRGPRLRSRLCRAMSRVRRPAALSL